MTSAHKVSNLTQSVDLNLISLQHHDTYSDDTALADIAVLLSFIRSLPQLPAKRIAHTVGPIFSYDARDKSERLLRSCYEGCLNKTVDEGLETIVSFKPTWTFFPKPSS
jgi:hypothetical protein